jgi:hypothetical protein
LPTARDQLPTARDHLPTCGQQTDKEPFKKTIPPTPQIVLPFAPALPRGASEGDWEAAAEFLFLEGIGSKAAGRIVAHWRRNKRAPSELVAELREAVATVKLDANAGKFARPLGAIVYRLETGAWPIAGVTSAREVAERDRARKERERRVAMEGILQDVVKAGRRAGQSDDQIKSVLRERMSEEFLVSQGW